MASHTLEPLSGYTITIFSGSRGAKLALRLRSGVFTTVFVFAGGPGISGGGDKSNLGGGWDINRYL